MNFNKHTVLFIEEHLEQEDSILNVYPITIKYKEYSLILTERYLVFSRKGLMKNKMYRASLNSIKSFKIGMPDVIKFEDGTKIKFVFSLLSRPSKMQYWLQNLANKNYIEKIKAKRKI